MINSVFDPNADQKKYKFWTQAEPPSKIYSILFTPRSGSSWLTSVLTKTKAIGSPGEWFNPELMPSSSRAKGARNLDQFIEAISRHETYGNIFGFEITFHQIRAVFGSEHEFMSRFQNATFFWLTRRDIVAQGVSLDKMVQTKVSHATNADSIQLENSDSSYEYNGDRIHKWIRHIRAAEKETEEMIEAYGLTPKRIFYEEITSSGTERVLDIFAEQLGLDGLTSNGISSSHYKIGTVKNDDFSVRFRDENKEFVDALNKDRASMLIVK